MRASAAGDMQVLRRTAALQIQLLELVVQQKDVAELVERVATILDVPIVLFDTAGAVVCASRNVPSAPELEPRLWAAYADQHGAPDPAGSVTNAGERVFFRDIQVMGRVERVLAAMTARHRATEFAGASLLFLQQLVTLDLLRSNDELRMRRRLRRGLLQDILSGDGTTDELRVRLQAQGFDDEDLLRVAILEPQSHRRSRSRGQERRPARHEPAARPRRRAQRAAHPVSERLHRGRAVVLTALPDADTATARGLLADLREAAMPTTSSGDAVAGSSAAFTGVAGATRALQQAARPAWPPAASRTSARPGSSRS